METQPETRCVVLKDKSMRAARTLISIPPAVAAKIDKLAGQEHRSEFIVEILEREIMRREQLAALELAAGCWKDEDHPELAQGSEAYVRQLRQEDQSRFEQIISSQE